MFFKRNKNNRQKETKIVVDEVPMSKGLFNLYASVGFLEFLATAFTIGYAICTLDIIGAIVLGIVTNIGVNLLASGCVLMETFADNFSATSRERKRLIKYGMDNDMINENHITAAVFSVAVDSMARNPRYANTDFDFVRRMAQVASGLREDVIEIDAPDNSALSNDTINNALNSVEDNTQEVQQETVEQPTVKKGDKIKYNLSYLENGFGLVDDNGNIVEIIPYDKVKQVETQEDLAIVPTEDCYGYLLGKEYDLFFYTDMEAILKVIK